MAFHSVDVDHSIRKKADFIFRTTACLPLSLLVISAPLGPSTLPIGPAVFDDASSYGTRAEVYHTPTSIYVIPRNFIYAMSHPYPTLWMTYPGFHPLTADNVACFKLLTRSCQPLILVIGGGVGPSHLQGLKNLLANIPWRPVGKVDGYTAMVVGEPRLRTVLYYKNGPSGLIYFDCFVTYNLGREISLCSDRFIVTNGDSVFFRFQKAAIPDVEKIEANVRRILLGFSAAARRKG